MAGETETEPRAPDVLEDAPEAPAAQDMVWDPASDHSRETTIFLLSLHHMSTHPALHHTACVPHVHGNHAGELLGIHWVVLVVLFGPLFATAGLSLLLLLVASIAAAVVIAFPPVRTCSSGVFVCPLAQLWLILLSSLVAFRPPHIEAMSEAGLEPGN